MELEDLGLSEEQMAELSYYGLNEQNLRGAIANPANQLWLKGKHPSFVERWRLSLRRLYACYKAIYPKAHPEEFKSVLAAVAAQDLVLDDPLTIPYQVASMEDREKGCEWVLNNTSHAVVLISSAYLLRALKSIDECQWADLADANYWCGAAMMQSNSSSPDYEKLVHRKIAEKGAQARDKKYAPLRELAWGLAREKRPKVQGWPSRRQAVFAVMEEVLEEARKRNTPLSEDNAFATIDGWLAKMPKVHELFPKRSKKSAE
ncbi:hypothetical protein [Bordetella petrii]|uniref:hypothetical protein n=1 Tax=Bordetella petrii TaxID=94624 RepID=UPI001A96C6A6|nr:hypothetical protein [Bordetella petrii]MBO1111825.1 hypothetical protein [Bordetella petrii]